MIPTRRIEITPKMIIGHLFGFVGNGVLGEDCWGSSLAMEGSGKEAVCWADISVTWFSLLLFLFVHKKASNINPYRFSFRSGVKCRP